MEYTHSVPQEWNSVTPLSMRTLAHRTPAVRSMLCALVCEAQIGSEYSAFFLGRAETRGNGYEPYTIYAGTNSDLLNVTPINQTSTEAQLVGCANTSFVPFTWKYSLPSPTVEQVDSAGGKTAFIVIPNITAQEPFGTQYVDTQWGMGLAYSYTAPGEIQSPTRR